MFDRFEQNIDIGRRKEKRGIGARLAPVIWTATTPVMSRSQLLVPEPSVVMSSSKQFRTVTKY